MSLLSGVSSYSGMPATGQTLRRLGATLAGTFGARAKGALRATHSFRGMEFLASKLVQLAMRKAIIAAGKAREEATVRAWQPESGAGEVSLLDIRGRWMTASMPARQ